MSAPTPTTKSGCAFKQALVDQRPVYDRGRKQRRRKRKKGNPLYD